MEIKKVPTESLRPFAGNPRTHSPEQIDKIVRSFAEFGWTNPILITKENTVVAGHARLEAAKKAGVKEVPVIILPFDGDKARAYTIADNKLTLDGDWDFTKLADLLTELNTGEFDLSLTGFDDRELEEVMNWTPDEVEEDNFDVAKAVEDIKEPICKRGQVWRLDRHRLMCGDATVTEDVERLMVGEKADMVFTDPPYNVNYDQSIVRNPGKSSRKRKFGKIKGDNLSDEDFIYLLKKSLVIPHLVKRGCVYYVCMGTKSMLSLCAVLEQANFYFSDLIVWKKPHFTMVRAGYQRDYELIWYGWHQSPALCQIEDRTQSDLWEIAISEDLIKRELGAGWKKRYEHPTQKPIRLAGTAIKNSSKRNNIIMDLFGGSGSTLIACEQLKRQCRMMEIDPIYCDVIINRWQDHTGKKAELTQ